MDIFRTTKFVFSRREREGPGVRAALTVKFALTFAQQILYDDLLSELLSSFGLQISIKFGPLEQERQLNEERFALI